MTLNQIRREARKRILRDGQSHQEVYEYYLEKTSWSQGEIAGELSKIPSQSILRKVRPLKITFVVCLGILVLYRVVTMIAFWEMTFLGFVPPMLILAALLSFFTPVLGIVTALLDRSWGYNTVAILLTIGMLRSLWSLLKFDLMITEGLLLTIPVIGAIVIGYMMPARLKTPVLSVARYEFDEKKGRDVKVYDYRFEEERAAAHGDLLDTDL